MELSSGWRLSRANAALLASHAGQVVTRRKSKADMGDDTFVDLARMNQCINQIRSVLNDSADRRFTWDNSRRGSVFSHQ